MEHSCSISAANVLHFFNMRLIFALNVGIDFKNNPILAEEQIFNLRINICYYCGVQNSSKYRPIEFCFMLIQGNCSSQLHKHKRKLHFSLFSKLEDFEDRMQGS